jgi:hypothetical protein
MAELLGASGPRLEGLPSGYPERKFQSQTTVPQGQLIVLIVKTDFPTKGLHFPAKCKIFPLTVKDAETALFARIQLGRSWARYPGRPRAFFGEPHVVSV